MLSPDIRLISREQIFYETNIKYLLTKNHVEEKSSLVLVACLCIVYRIMSRIH